MKWPKVLNGTEGCALHALDGQEKVAYPGLLSNHRLSFSISLQVMLLE